MQVRQTMTSKKGSKRSPFKEDIIWKDLSSMIHQNSHDFPEILLNSSDIYFSGSEDSPEKMTIISTKFDLVFDYNLLFKDAFDGCMANETCSQAVPGLINIANVM